MVAEDRRRVPRRRDEERVRERGREEQRITGRESRKSCASDYLPTLAADKDLLCAPLFELNSFCVHVSCEHTHCPLLGTGLNSVPQVVPLHTLSIGQGHACAESWLCIRVSCSELAALALASVASAEHI